MTIQGRMVPGAGRPARPACLSRLYALSLVHRYSRARLWRAKDHPMHNPMDALRRPAQPCALFSKSQGEDPQPLVKGQAFGPPAPLTRGFPP